MVGSGSESGNVALRVRYEGSCLTMGKRWTKDCPKHVELILEINKLLLLHLVGSSILLYLH